MIATRRPHPLLLWTLCLSVLLSLHLCGLRHGQSSALALSGLAGGFCSSDSAGFDASPAEDAEPLGDWSCPLCQNPGASDGGWNADGPMLAGTGLLLLAGRAVRRSRRRYTLACSRAP